MEITVIKEENQEYFKPLMPNELWEQSDVVLGAIDEGVACAVLAAEEKPEYILALRYLYVAEDYRRKGIATALLEGLHDLGMRGGMNMTICQYTLNEEQKDLDLCLTKNLFELDETDSPVYRVAFGDLSPKYFEKKADEDLMKKNVVPLSEITARMWNRFLDRYSKRQEKGEENIDLEIKYLYDQDASFLLMKRGEPVGCILFERLEEDFLLSYLCVMEDASPLDMMLLFQASYQNLKERCKDSTQIYINALTEKTEKLVQNLSDQKADLRGKAITRYYFY